MRRAFEYKSYLLASFRPNKGHAKKVTVVLGNFSGMWTHSSKCPHKSEEVPENRNQADTHATIFVYLTRIRCRLCSKPSGQSPKASTFFRLSWCVLKISAMPSPGRISIDFVSSSCACGSVNELTFSGIS